MNVLDTSLLIEIARKSQKGVQIAEQLKQELVVITSVSFYEFSIGIRTGMEEQFIDLFEVVDLDRNAAKQSSKIFRELKSRGVALGTSDILIAGICLANKATLHTADKDFAKIKGLKFELY